MTINHKKPLLAFSSAAVLMAASGLSYAETGGSNGMMNYGNESTGGKPVADAPLQLAQMDADEFKDEYKDAKETEMEAVKVASQMTQDTNLKQLLSQAKGVFIIPDYARAGLVVGAKGGQGVLMFKENGQWQGPAFYNIGGISLGAQGGVEAGAIAMILMSDKALDNFDDTQNFSLSADAGLTIINYSKRARASTTDGDVIVWSDTEGAWADLAVAIQDVIWDAEENQAYYRTAAITPDTVAGLKKQKESSELESALD